MTNDNRTLEQRINDMKARFESAPQRARDERDDELRAIAEDFGLRQVELVAKTGYSRETVRQALNPANRDAIRARRRVDARQELAYLAARTHLSPVGWGHEVVERVARDIAARVAGGDPYDERALRRLAEAIAQDVPGDGLKQIPIYDALKAAQESTSPGPDSAVRQA